MKRLGKLQASTMLPCTVQSYQIIHHQLLNCATTMDLWPKKDVMFTVMESLLHACFKSLQVDSHTEVKPLTAGKVFHSLNPNTPSQFQTAKKITSKTSLIKLQTLKLEVLHTMWSTMRANWAETKVQLPLSGSLVSPSFASKSNCQPIA